MAKKPAGRDALEDLSLALNVLAYFANHEGATVFEAGEELGVDGPDIQDILWELWTCGVPGYAHGDLIDLDPDPRAVTVINPQGLDRPMRLTPFEAAMLLVVLHDVVDSVSPRAAGAANRRRACKALRRSSPPAPSRSSRRTSTSAWERRCSTWGAKASISCAVRWAASSSCGPHCPARNDSSREGKKFTRMYLSM